MDQETPSQPPENVSKKHVSEDGDKISHPSAGEHQEQEHPLADKDGFALPLIDVLLGLGVLGLFPDILDDLGLHTFTIWAWWLSLVLGALAVVHSVATIRPAWKRNIWIGFKMFSVLTIVAFSFWTHALLKPKPEVTPEYPHFTFALLNPETKKVEIELTNEFLSATNFRLNKYTIPSGYLFVPLTSNSTSVDFLLKVTNQGPVPSDRAEVRFCADERLSVKADGWYEALTGIEIISQFSSRKWETNKTDSWICNIPDKLSGDGVLLPKLTVRNIIWRKGTDVTAPIVGILVKGNKTPAQSVEFKIIFCKVSNGAPKYPVMGRAKIVNGAEVFNFPPEIFKYMVP